jgi:hypothetical protein
VVAGSEGQVPRGPPLWFRSPHISIDNISVLSSLSNSGTLSRAIPSTIPMPARELIAINITFVNEEFILYLHLIILSARDGKVQRGTFGPRTPSVRSERHPSQVLWPEIRCRSCTWIWENRGWSGLQLDPRDRLSVGQGNCGGAAVPLASAYCFLLRQCSAALSAYRIRTHVFCARILGNGYHARNGPN